MAETQVDELRDVDWSHQLRQARQSPADDDDEDDDDDDDDEEDTDYETDEAADETAAAANDQEMIVSSGLREQVQQNRRQTAAAAVGEVSGSNLATASMASSYLLRASWESLLATAGWSMIGAFFYLNLHVFLHFVLGEDKFCKLGAEWPSNNGELNFAKGLGEASLLALIDFAVVVALLTLGGIVFMGVYYYTQFNIFDPAWWTRLFS